MGAFNSNTPGLTPRLALLCNVSSLLMTVQINWSRCFILFFHPLSPPRLLPPPACLCEEATNSVCSCTCCREADCSINQRNYSSRRKRNKKHKRGARGPRAVGTGTLSTRASAVRCVKARSSAETSHRKTLGRQQNAVVKK